MRGNLFFVGTGAFVLGILVRTLYVISWPIFGFAFALGCFGILLCFLKNRAVAVVFAVVFFPTMLGIVRTALAPSAIAAPLAPLLNTNVALTGTIVADPDIRQKNQQLVVEVHQNGSTNRVLALAPRYQHFVYGERVSVSGKLTLPAPFATEGGRSFRYDQYLQKKGIFSVIMHARVVEVSPPSGLWNAAADTLFSMKHAFIRGLSIALPSPYAEIATGLLTGEQHHMSPEIIALLSLSGLIWIVVLAGYHITLITRGVLAGLSFLPQRVAFGAAMLCIAALVFATGASAPSLRGSLMAGLALFARGTGRTYDAVRALLATIILMLLWNPFLLAYDLGFQLSALVTLGIILAAPLLETRLLWVKSSLLREVIAVSTVAQLACLPLLVWELGQLELWAIPANLLVMAFVPLMMLLSIVAGFGGVAVNFLQAAHIAGVAYLGPLLGLPAYALLYYLLTVAKISVTLPFAATTLPAFPFAFVVLAYALLIGLLLKLKSQTL